MAQDDVRRSLHAQAEACDALGSPFTAAVLRAAESRLDRGTAVGRRILDWTGDPTPRGDVVGLRLAGALHALVLSGRAPHLAALYPPHAAPDADRLATAVADTLETAAPFVLGFLDRPPQTNEVARSAILYAGLVALARRLERPVALMEIGSSAGLNLLPDRYRHDLGGRVLGDPASTVRLRPAWSGPPPTGPEPVVAERRGCDIAPVDIADPAERLRLRAYTWADQAERLARQEAALAIALDDPPVVDRQDAASWVEETFSTPRTDGIVPVLMHSIALQYVPAAGQTRIAAAMETAGGLATLDAPVAWLSFEQADGGTALALRIWPGGGVLALATADPHVRQVHWHA